MKHRRTAIALPLIILASSIISAVLTLQTSVGSAFREWNFFGAFMCAFEQVVLYWAFSSIVRNMRKSGASTTRKTYELGGWLILLWIAYLFIRASLALPPQATIPQSIAFSLFGLALSLLPIWLRVSSRLAASVKIDI